MGNYIEVCPWTISVSAPERDTLHPDLPPYERALICNQVKGLGFVAMAVEGEIASVADEVLTWVLRHDNMPVFLAWDKNADDLFVAMKSINCSEALFAEGYGADVPVIISKD